jgi:hypothetical protein
MEKPLLFRYFIPYYYIASMGKVNKKCCGPYGMAYISVWKWKKPAALQRRVFRIGVLERREVEKRFYGGKGSGSRLPQPFCY